MFFVLLGRYVLCLGCGGLLCLGDFLWDFWDRDIL